MIWPAHGTNTKNKEKLVPAWDPIHGSRPGSSLGCLAVTGRVQWTLESPAAVAGQCRERGELGRYPAGTRTCHQQYDAWLAASVVLVARPGNSDHRPLQLAQWKRVENSRDLTRPLRPSATCWTSGDNAASRRVECLISQGSVATCLRWGGYCHMAFIANFIRFPAVQKFGKSIKIWQS